MANKNAIDAQQFVVLFTEGIYLFEVVWAEILIFAGGFILLGDKVDEHKILWEIGL